MSKTFSQESSEAFLSFTKSALRRTKKITSVFQQTALKRTSKKRTLLSGFSKEKLVGTSFEQAFS